MPLQRAIIEIDDPQAVDASRGLKKTFPVQFNPTEYTLNKGAQIAEINIPGIDSPILQFIRGQNQKLTVELTFDTASEAMDESARDVRELTRPFYQLVKIQPKTHAVPRVILTWGPELSIKAIVESVQQKFTLFSPTGVPLRANLTVTFREYRTLEEQIAELKFESSDHTKRHVVKRGDTLSRIAAEEYRDPREWRHIADANRDVLENPRRLEPGTILVIPPLDGFGTAVTEEE